MAVLKKPAKKTNKPKPSLPRQRTAKKSPARAPKRKLTRGPRTQAVRESLQEQVYNLRVLECWSVEEVCTKLGMSSKTVLAYEKAELTRRAEENAERRECDQEVSIARYERIFRKGMELAERSTSAFMQPLIRGLDSAAKAQERIDKIKGLDAPTKVELGVQQLIEALSIPEEPKE